MKGLRHLGLGDLATVAVAVAIGNAITLALFVVLGVSSVPQDGGTVGLVGGFLAVVVGLTILPAILLFVFTYLSFRMA